MNKLYRTWSLMSASWRILKEDKKLLLFPMMSGISCLAVMASFAIPAVLTGQWRPPAHSASQSQLATYYGLLFLYYYCNYFVIVFFNTALIACAVSRLRGGEPTIADGLRAAGARLPLIAGWALASATVGLALRVLEDRSERVGEFVAALLGMGWTVVTFLVVPILVVEGKNPISAVKESGLLLKKTWGEQLAGSFSFSMITFLFSIPAVAVIFLGIYSGNALAMGVCIFVGIIYFLLLALVQSALETIFQTAVYLYARNNEIPPGFHEELLKNAMVRK